MNAVIAALKKAGGENVQTQQVSLYPSHGSAGQGHRLHRTEHGVREGEDRRGGRAGRRRCRRRPTPSTGRRSPFRSGCAVSRRVEESGTSARESTRDRRGRRVRRRPRLDRRRAGATGRPEFSPVALAAKDASTPIDPGRPMRRQTSRCGSRFASRQGEGQAKGPFAARTDAAGGALPVGQVHRQRLVAGAPERCRPCHESAIREPSFRSNDVCPARPLLLAGDGGRDESAG